MTVDQRSGKKQWKNIFIIKSSTNLLTMANLVYDAVGNENFLWHLCNLL
jgi:hypothetical protein